MFAVHQEVICHILKLYLSTIGNTVRKQPQQTNRYAVVGVRNIWHLF